MATFKERVASLIDTIPNRITDADLDQWTKDGLVDVVRRAINKDPLKAELFAKSNLTSSSIGIDAKYGVVISATLNNVSCDEVSYKMKGQIQDSDSIHYRTANNPCYYREAGKVFIYPYSSVPGNQSLSNPISVYGGEGVQFTLNTHGYTNGTALFMTGMVTETSGDADPFINVSVIITDVSTNNFTVMIPFPESTITVAGAVYGFEGDIVMPAEPDSSVDSSSTNLTNCDVHHESLVALYMAQRCAFAGMSSILMENNPMDTFPIQPSSPESPNFSDIQTITFEDSGMIYQEGTAGTTGADVDSSNQAIDWNAMLGTVTAPTYSGPVVFPDYSSANAFLDEEDVELVQAKLNIIQTELQEYQGSIQEALNKLGKYQAEIGSWQQEVGKILQEYSAKIQGDNTEYQWYVGKYSMLRKEYLEGF